MPPADDDPNTGDPETSAAPSDLESTGIEASASPSGGDGEAPTTPAPAPRASGQTAQAHAAGGDAAPRGGGLSDEEDDGEDLFGDNMADDYRPMGRLDEYEEDGLDNEQYEEDADARFAAEAALNARDAREQYGRQRGPRALQDDVSDDDGDAGFARRRHQQAADAAEGEGFGADDGGDGLELSLDSFDPQQMSLQEWISQTNIANAVKRHFHRFLQHFTTPTAANPTGMLPSADAGGADAGTGATNVYLEAVRHMCSANKESLEVSYPHMSAAVPTLAMWVADCPAAMLPLLDEEAMRFVLRYFPEYTRIQSEVHVRITHLPIHDSIRDLRQCHLGCLVQVSGVVTRRSQVFPQLKVVKFDCGKCGAVLGPFVQRATDSEVKPGLCSECQAKGPFTLNVEETVYRNYQKVTVQESPGTVPAGRLPRHKEVVLLADLIDCARPGEEVEVSGIYMNNYDALLNKKNGFPVFTTVIEANHVSKRSEQFAVHKLTDEETAAIRRLAQDPAVTQRIFDSVAPSIYGHADIKRSVALSLFGGQAKDVQNRHRIRGDINVLLLGDPGTAKSQFLKYIEKTAHRAVYATGQGASAVGLTAAVHRDQITREWTLEGGALVLADRGVCLIDEFDKMNDQDRTSIHEAMEQQSISISKAGIVTSLQARCAVIAAANPVNGRYDTSQAFSDNVELSEPILSRFDVTCILRDTANPVLDEQLAEFVLDSHARSHPDASANGGGEADTSAATGSAGLDAPTTAAGATATARPGRTAIPQELLRKYILHARTHCHPVLQDVDADKIVRFYTELRKESHRAGGIVVAVRHLESLIRLAEAAARTQLRSHVRDDDIDLAISVMLRSFISSQKYTVAQSMERKFARYLNLRQDVDELLFFLLNRLYAEEAEELDIIRRQRGLVADPAEVPQVRITCAKFEDKAREHNIYDVTPFYRSSAFVNNGFHRDAEANVISRQT